MTYTVHPAAEQDIADASDSYKERAGTEVARRFLAEVDRVANLVNRNPEGGAPLTKGRRVFHLKVFPYSLVYRSLAGGIQVLVVRHQHRRPSFGMGRR
jgi:plasmid stabilization system protein ParE